MREREPRTDHPAMPEHRWVFRAALVRVVDGDTVRVELDGGFRNYQQEQLRLLGVDTPEVVGANRAAGLAAKEYAVNWFAEAAAGGAGAWTLVVQTVKTDAFGRYLATVWRVSDGRCLNDDLLAAGHATPYRAWGVR